LWKAEKLRAAFGYAFCMSWKALNVLPRFIRLRDAPGFFGMDRSVFTKEIRPLLTEIRIGRQGIAFDRLDMGRIAEEYKQRYGRPAPLLNRRYAWDEQGRRASSGVAVSGTSTKRCVGTEEFEKALERATSKKRNDSLPVALRR
jgi:hypothetical protein